jgi:hypothetical protein
MDTNIEVENMDRVKRVRSRWFGNKRKENPFTSDYKPSWEITISRRGGSEQPRVMVHRAA